MAASSPMALDGLVVLDLSRILAGPTATQMLGDFGAKVIKVENPKSGGDDTRAWGPPYMMKNGGEPSDISAYFMAANRNKLSLEADISTPEGQATIRALAACADVVIENFKPDGLKKYGLDHATLCAAHPGLVYCSISGFGQTGPNRDKPGYDLMAQGYGGIMSLTGDPDGPPMKVGVGIADVMCGMYACIGILAALRHRDATGEGQHIDLSLVDAQMAWLINEGTNALVTGQSPKRRGNAHPNIVPYDAFEVADGHVLIAVGNDAQFARFCHVIGRSDLSETPQFATNPKRLENRDALLPQIKAALLHMTTAEITEALTAAKVPVGPIHTVEQALSSDQAIARESVTQMEVDGLQNPMKLLSNPLKLSKTPVTYRHAPPRFGQDTAEVLKWLAKQKPE